MWKKFILLLSLDQISKCLIEMKFTDYLVKNFGSAFSLPIPQEILVIIALLISSWAIWSYYENNTSESFTYLILAGAIGNLIDRLRLGYVIDFINLQVWPVFNFADIYITLAVMLIIKEEITQKNGK
ncbi:signal peptidase II [bacterium]|jgi:signal peptidase II|nr:signal peptidase II [bacterium]MBT6293941.1 signal peptidase II [bacterium]